MDKMLVLHNIKCNVRDIVDVLPTHTEIKNFNNSFFSLIEES